MRHTAGSEEVLLVKYDDMSLAELRTELETVEATRKDLLDRIHLLVAEGATESEAEEARVSRDAQERAILSDEEAQTVSPIDIATRGAFGAS